MNEVFARGGQPYPGLRPFTRFEAPIFHGRAQHVVDMLTRLEKTRFLAVVGGSGSGKSSLVRAGLLPALKKGYLLSAGADWRFIVIKPGNNPYRNLAHGIRVSAEGVDHPAPADVSFTDAILRTSHHSFVEALGDVDSSSDNQELDTRPVLLLVDQFEELFRFRQLGSSTGESKDQPTHERRNEAAGFVSLILAAAKQVDVSVHVILTMRSDFIGDCDAFEGLPNAVSSSQFLVPRLTREQMHDAIEKPLVHFDASAEAALVNRVINDAGTDPDQLPLMQHALMRSWYHAKARWVQDTAVDRILTLVDYQAVGGFQEALTQHANEAFLDEKADDAIIRNLFLCLSRRESNGQIVRRDATIAEVAAIAGVTPERVYPVVHAFRENHRHFIVASPPDDLTADTVLDLSHEALLRQWDKLEAWIDEEADSAADYLWLVDNARRKGQTDEIDSLRGLDLQRALKWKERQNPNAAWAARYDSSFDEAIGYLSASEEAEEIRLRQENKTRRLVLRVVVGLVLFVLATLMFWALGERETAQQKRNDAEEAQEYAQHLLQSASSRQIAFASETVEKADSGLSLLLAMEAVEIEFTPEAIKELYDSLTASNERLKIRHPQTVRYAAWNAAGDRILTYCIDGRARLWSYDRERIRAQLMNDWEAVENASWDTDRANVLTLQRDDTIVMFDRDGELIQRGEVPDTLIPVNLRSRKSEAVWPREVGHFKQAIERSISDSLGNEIPIDFIRGHLQTVKHVALKSPWRSDIRNLFLTVSEDNTGRVWTDSPTQPALRTTLGIPFQKTNGFEKTIERAGRSQKAIFRGHSGSVLWGSWHPEGKHVITASKDTTVRIWEVDVLVNSPPKLPQDTDWIPTLRRWSADGSSILQADDEGEVRLYPDVDGQPATYLLLNSPRNEKIDHVTFYPDNGRAPIRKIVTTTDLSLSAWDIPESTDIPVHQEPLIPTLSIPKFSQRFADFTGWSDSGELLLLTLDAVLMDYAELGKDPRTFTIPHARNSYANISPDGRMVLLADDEGDVRVYSSAANLKDYVRLIGHQEQILDADWYQDGGSGGPVKILTTSFDQIPRVWTIPPLEKFSADKPLAINPTLELVGHLTPVRKGRWKPQGHKDESYEPRILTVGVGGTVGLWDGNGKNVAFLGADSDKISEASWTNEGNILVIHPDGSSRIWPGTVEELLSQAKARESWVIDIESGSPKEGPRVLTPDERRLNIDD